VASTRSCWGSSQSIAASSSASLAPSTPSSSASVLRPKRRVADSFEPRLVGVPGIGKSRLVAELAERVEADPELISWRQGRCPLYGDCVAF
jgi:hypothetical protein